MFFNKNFIEKMIEICLYLGVEIRIIEIFYIKLKGRYWR